MRRGILALLLFLVLLKPAALPVWGQEETEELAGDLQEDLLNREEIKEVQKALEELLGEDSFPLSLIHISEPRDISGSRMPSSA